MYCGKYAPWDHYPKTLRLSEVQNPLSVVIDFFSADWPDGHFKQLKNWRYFVVNFKHYKNKKHGPGELLGTYEFNVKLLESLYLLLLEHQDSYSPVKKISEEQLKKETEEWFWFPDNLSKEELIDPYLPIKTAFKKIKPQMFRDYLADWIHAALSKSAIDETVTPGEIITVYEHLAKLYSAAWLIHQRESERPVLKKELRLKKEQSYDEEAKSTSHLTETVSTELHPAPTPAEKLGLKEVTSLVLKTIPAVQLIIHLGTHREPFTYYLLLLTDDSDKAADHEISNKIEDNCRQLVSVFTFVQKVKNATHAIKAGARFIDHALEKGEAIYRSDKLELPPIIKLTSEEIAGRRNKNWKRWGEQGREFYKGAKQYQQDNNYKLAAFLLHQAAESTLIALIKVALGYRTTTHSLSRMLKITLLFTDDIKKLFKLDTEEGVQTYNLLQSAYSYARYKEDFNPDEASINVLMDTVDKLLKTAEIIYLKFMTADESE